MVAIFVVFVVTRHDRVFTVPERVFTVFVRFVTFVLVVARFHERVAMFPVAVAILVFVVASPVVRVVILVSCIVLLPWSFWNAESTESAAVTVPDHATNAVRREVRDILELKVFQSIDERAPVVDVEARTSESCCHESESPFGVPRVTGE